MRQKKLAIISTHPIQYNAPLFRSLAETEGVSIKVFYTWSQAREAVSDKDFGQKIKWDIPLLDGYDWQFVPNVSSKPKQTFGGLVNPDLIPAIEQWGADALMVFGWNFSSHFKAMRHFHGRIPVWFRGDSTLLDETPSLHTLVRRMVLRYVYSHIDKAFYVGENNRRYFKAHGLRDDALIFAPHAVENSRFDTAESASEGSQLRNDLGLTDNDIVMVFAGKIIPCKNMVEFSHQFAEYMSSVGHSNLKLLIIGDGVQSDKLARHASILRMPFQNQSRMPAVYKAADILVLPSISETWGLAVNEAMAAGRPAIVTSKVGCAYDLVIDGKTGFYFDLNSPEANRNLFAKLENSDLRALGDTSKAMIASWSHRETASIIANELNKLK